MKLHIGKNTENVLDEMANYVHQQIKKAIDTKGKCSIALAGGNTPKALYKKLAQPAIASTIDWEKVYFFWGDERYVHPSHNDSNQKMARENLLQLIAVPASNIFPIPTATTPENDAATYNSTLVNFFGNHAGFDLVLLGLGSDGHTLSLFPNTSILQQRANLVSNVWVEQLHTNRISLTYTCAAKAAQLIFLVTGADKASVIEAIVNNAPHAQQFPATILVQENSPKVHWFIEDVVKLAG